MPTKSGTDINLNTAYEDFETRDPREYALREQEVAKHLVEMDKFFATKLKTAGGPGSGNFGHSGRPGEVGGSGGGGERRDRRGNLESSTFKDMGGNTVEVLKHGDGYIVTRSWDVDANGGRNAWGGPIDDVWADQIEHHEVFRADTEEAALEAASRLSYEDTFDLPAGVTLSDNAPNDLKEQIEKRLKTDYAAFEKRALENLAGTSRTAKGVSDTGTSAEKQKLAVKEGDQLAAKTAENFKGAIKHVWDERSREFKSAEDVHKFTENLARKVSEGLLPSGQGLYRTWETPNNQTPPKEIKEATRKFTGQLYDKLSSGADPVATAAWVEKRMSVIHPWSDGVGRSTKALSAFVPARGGQSLPKYPDTKTYYSEIKKSPESWEKFYKPMF